MKARISADIDREKLKWIEAYCDKENISRNKFFDMACELYIKTLEGESENENKGEPKMKRNDRIKELIEQINDLQQNISDGKSGLDLSFARVDRLQDQLGLLSIGINDIVDMDADEMKAQILKKFLQNYYLDDLIQGIAELDEDIDEEIAKAETDQERYELEERYSKMELIAELAVRVEDPREPDIEAVVNDLDLIREYLWDLL